MPYRQTHAQHPSQDAVFTWSSVQYRQHSLLSLPWSVQSGLATRAGPKTNSFQQNEYGSCGHLPLAAGKSKQCGSHDHGQNAIKSLTSQTADHSPFLLAVKLLQRFQFFYQGLVLVFQDGYAILKTLDILLFLPTALSCCLPRNPTKKELMKQINTVHGEG